MAHLKRKRNSTTGQVCTRNIWKWKLGQMHHQTYLSSQKWILWLGVLEFKHRTPKRFLLRLHYFLTLLNCHIDVYAGRHVSVTSIPEKSQPSLEHNSHIHTTFCKRSLWHITAYFPVSPTQACIAYCNSCPEVKGHGQHSLLAIILTLCAVVLPDPGNRHLASGAPTSALGQLFITWQLLVMSGMFWSGAVWVATVITTKYSQWFRAAWELHFSGGVPTSPAQSEPVQPGQVPSRAPVSQRDTRQAGETEAAQCFCIQQVTDSLSKDNHCSFHLQDSRGPSLSSPTPSPSFKSHKYSAMMANVAEGSTLGALLTTYLPTHRCWRLSFPKIRIIRSWSGLG